MSTNSRTETSILPITTPLAVLFTGMKSHREHGRRVQQQHQELIQRVFPVVALTLQAVVLRRCWVRLAQIAPRKGQEAITPRGLLDKVRSEVVRRCAIVVFGAALAYTIAY